MGKDKMWVPETDHTGDTKQMIDNFDAADTEPFSSVCPAELSSIPWLILPYL